MRVNDVILFVDGRHGAFVRRVNNKIFCRYFTHYDRGMNSPSDGSTMNNLTETTTVVLPREFLYA